MPISINKDRQVFDEAGVAYTIGDLIAAMPSGVKIYALAGLEEKVYVEAADIHGNRHAVRKMSDAIAGKKKISGSVSFSKLFWPEKVVKGENAAEFTGFITSSPKIQGDLSTLEDIIEERKGKAKLSQEEEKHYLDLGVQLAEIVEAVHECGYIAGVLSPDKLWVSGEGVLLSCSTYQFSFESSDAFDNPYYVAPEWLSSINRKRIIYSQESDAFIYALILFQLLTGKYPFLPERNISEVGKEELWEQMVDGKSVYFWEDVEMIGAVGEELQGLSAEIDELFKRTFDYCGYDSYDEQRVSIPEWLMALKGNPDC